MGDAGRSVALAEGNTQAASTQLVFVSRCHGDGGLERSVSGRRGQLQLASMRPYRMRGREHGAGGAIRVDDHEARVDKHHSGGEDQGRLLSDVIKQELGVPESDRFATLLGIQLSQLLSDIHATTYVWRDLKATNLILTTSGTLRPIDFEGSMPTGTRIRARWGSPGMYRKNGQHQSSQALSTTCLRWVCLLVSCIRLVRRLIRLPHQTSAPRRSTYATFSDVSHPKIRARVRPPLRLLTHYRRWLSPMALAARSPLTRAQPFL